MAYDSILDALGDPTRRRLLEALRGHRLTVGALAQTQTVSRPAVSQHLKILADAGLVQVQAQGNRRLFSIRQDALLEVRAWMEEVWGGALDAYAAEIQRQFGN